MGLKGASLNLFRDYLSDRTQVTVITNVNSITSFISCGVPQGSILGLLLFLLYINPIKSGLFLTFSDRGGGGGRASEAPPPM